jgi:Tol biopolymer transport system component
MESNTYEPIQLKNMTTPTVKNSTNRPPSWRGLSLIALALALIGGVLGRSANAAFPGENGKIAFQSSREGHFAIFTVEPGGCEHAQLTSGLADDETPSWSADGSKIVFMSDRNGNFQIYSMNSDGSGQTRLTNNASNDQTPAWSPDGSKIVFVSDRDGNLEIYSMNSDGSGQTRLTDNAGADQFPALVARWNQDCVRQ